MFLSILNIHCVWAWYQYNIHNTCLHTKLLEIAYKFCYCSNKNREENPKLKKKTSKLKKRTSKLKEITQNSRKNSKLKEKTQNSRKKLNSREKLNFSAYSYVCQGEKIAKLKACLSLH